MNAHISPHRTAPLVPLGCLTLPLHVSPFENHITAYDDRHPVLSVARLFPEPHSSKKTSTGAPGRSKDTGGTSNGCRP
jgi:hypothetical protein